MVDEGSWVEGIKRTRRSRLSNTVNVFQASKLNNESTLEHRDDVHGRARCAREETI